MPRSGISTVTMTISITDINDNPPVILNPRTAPIALLEVGRGGGGGGKGSSWAILSLKSSHMEVNLTRWDVHGVMMSSHIADTVTWHCGVLISCYRLWPRIKWNDHLLYHTGRCCMTTKSKPDAFSFITQSNTPFSIDPHSGVVRLTSRLDFNVAESYALTITAQVSVEQPQSTWSV